MKAKDLMNPLVLFVYPDDPARHAVEVMAEQRVSGLPVVDPQRRLVGVVSERDLLLIDEIEDRKCARWGTGDTEAPEGEASDCLRVGDVMTKDVIAYGPDDELVDIARTIYERGINRVPIVDAERKVIGLVARADIIRALAAGKDLRS
ncbi:MAG: CBS domain-containing protein [Armatimonadetes bacterium]|nr:CBS domain-containing protein [Armatimonadota bacterium]